jgi:hypothetical protein
MALVNYWPDFFAGLRDLVRTAWPDVLPATPPEDGGGGIWESTQSAQTAYHRARLPKAVLRILPGRAEGWNSGGVTSGAPMSNPEWHGGQAIVYHQPVEFWYVDRDPGSGGSLPLRGKLKALQDLIVTRDYVLEANGTRFKCVYVYHFEVSEESEGNRAFFSRDTAYLAGSIAVAFLLGDFPD